MTSQLPEIILASDNPGKFAEYKALLQGICLVRPQSDFALKTPPETGNTFAENAILKARFVSASTQRPALADDSGLEVDALDGEPGIFSARYAGPNASDDDNVRKLLDKVADMPPENLTARFHCVIAYVSPQMAEPIVAHSTWEGHLVQEACGENGFGYDPIFYVPEHACTAAQLAPSLKNRLSHRGRALQQIKEKMKLVL